MSLPYRDYTTKTPFRCTRVYDLLCEAQADFDISYASVLCFVQKWKKEQIQAATLGFSHLTWYPGDCN